MSAYLKHLLHIVLSFVFFVSLHAENCSYADLLKTCEKQQVIALREAGAFLDLQAETQFTPLKGGLTSAKLYSFNAGEEKYVLRFLAAGPNQTKEMRQNEILALKIGNRLGIAPECIFSDQNAVLLIMPFIEGDSLRNPNADQLSQIGKMLRSLHNFSGYYPTKYTFHENLMRHYQKGIKTGIAFPTGFGDEIQSVVNRPNLRPLVPCHGDLNPSNILVSNSCISIIDWTTASWDDPFVDLSYFCFLSNLSLDQEIIFLEAYFGRAPTAKELEILNEEKTKVYLLTAAIWFRFSETSEERKLPMNERVAKLDAILLDDELKPAQEYLREGIVVNLYTAPASMIKAYALSFYKAYLEKN